MAGGARPDPFRTRKLSRRAPMVLRGKPVGEQGAADRWTALPYRCRAGPSGAPLLFCLPGAPTAAPGRARYSPGRPAVGPSGGAGPPGGRRAPRPFPPRMCRNRGGRERRPRGAPGMAIYLLAARRSERPAARTLRTGYCEARGRAWSMVDRRETELKNHFDGEQ